MPGANRLIADYVARIERARVYDSSIETRLDFAPRLSRRLHNDIFLKREDLQPIFSFKCRGAENRLAQIPKAVLGRGVIASSAGNHAQGVALAAGRLGVKALIVMPRTTASIKTEAVSALGRTPRGEGEPAWEPDGRPARTVPADPACAASAWRGRGGHRG